MSTTATAEKPPQKLDELMLAMDVVDTIRHRELIVARELGQGDRDAELRARLRDIYRSQGIEVSDRAIDQGIAALKEQRFVYTPPPPGAARTLALFWVRRRQAGIALLAAAVAGVLLWGGYQAAVVWPAQWEQQRLEVQFGAELPEALRAAYGAAQAEALTDDARAQAESLRTRGEAAIAARDAGEAQASIGGLEALTATLRQDYTLRIVSRPGEDTGVFRVPDDNPRAQNYYLIVEAIGPEGRALRVPVTSEEDQRTREVRKWGVRVPQTTFEAVRRDKADDGIVQNDVLGRKARGALAVEYAMPVAGGAITDW